MLAQEDSDSGSTDDFLDILSLDPSGYPTIHLSATVDTETGTAGDLTREDFTIVEDGTEKEIDPFRFTPDAADIVFVFDDTGSMGSQISGLKSSLNDFVASLADAGTDARYGLVSFKDDVEVDQPFTDSVEEIQSAVDGLTASGGGNYRENNFDALEEALALDYRSGVQKIVIDITDAPAHTSETDEFGEEVTDLDMDDAVEMLQRSGATYFALSSELLGDFYADGDKQVLAERVGGTWYDLTSADFEELLDEVVTTLTTTYVLGYSTCVPPGETVSVELSVDDPDEGEASVTSELTVPEEFDLPAECGGDPEPEPASITFDDQTTDGSTVTVRAVDLPEGGYVTVRDDDDTVLGHSAYLGAGGHSDVEITLDSPLADGQTLVATAHTDDGDESYEFPDADGPYTVDDEPVADEACVEVC